MLVIQQLILLAVLFINGVYMGAVGIEAMQGFSWQYMAMFIALLYFTRVIVYKMLSVDHPA